MTVTQSNKAPIVYSKNRLEKESESKIFSPIKSNSHDITEILLKVALNTTTQTYANG
jgi:hypothetical protein